MGTALAGSIVIGAVASSFVAGVLAAALAILALLDARRGPVGRHVGSALGRPAGPEAAERRARDELARHDRLALAELRRECEQRGWHEGERLREYGQVGPGVHSHEDEVVALRDDVLVHLLRP